MNFFKRKDAFRNPFEPGEGSESGPHFEAEQVTAASPEPAGIDGWSDAPAESDATLIADSEDAPAPVPAQELREYDPVAGEMEMPEGGSKEADSGAKPDPFEERLARLRRQLQEGPRLIPDAPVEAEAEPEPVTEPAPPEPAPVLVPKPASDILVEMAGMAPAQDPPPAVAAADEAHAVVADAQTEIPVPIVPESPIGGAGRRAGRVKTRLLGFERGASSSSDPLGSAAKEERPGRFPVGWIVVVKGPGRGASFCLYNGLSQIGRGSDQTVCLDFGDTSISRENHAVVAYDLEQKKHFLGHGGKANIVRLNDMPVLSTEELSHGDQIRIGETTLRFVALCGADFDWSMTAPDDDFDVAVV